ncbi:Ger(x)C family spore germination protein [Schinkia azotoformans]|uniref:Ger(x)C family spore germination protein n=1 Tax=Schinkia azotoformans TaxID=1454 RepID=UPI002E1A0AC9|nr:Ger(x)C family spore germination protein [Schinkia azotoformans]
MLFLKRQGILFLCICIVLFLSGCWGRKEVNDLAIIVAAGLDKKSDEKLELTVQVYTPKAGGGGQQMGESGSGGGGQPVVVRSAEGVTIADAMSKLQQLFPRQLFWGHAEVFIINEKLAREDIRPKLDFILRHPQLRDRSHIYVSKDPAKKVLRLTPPLERDLSEVLRELSMLKTGIEITIKEAAQMFIGDSGASALPLIEVLKSQPPAEENQTIAYINGTAIFKKGKMVGTIDGAQTRGVLWLRNEISQAVVTVKPRIVDGYISMVLLHSYTKLIPSIENGRWKITLKATTEVDIINNGTVLDITDQKTIEMLEHKLEKDIHNRVYSALAIVQKEMNADIFGFSDAFHRSYPDIWNKNKENWDEIFPQVEVLIEARAIVRRPGMVTRPSLIPEEEVVEE